jgi:hypothetical protein
MQFRTESTIGHPRDAVFAAYRDRLPEIAAYLDDISEIRVLSRAEEAGLVKLHNEWASSREVPAVARGFLKPEHLRWDDYASWDAAAWTVTYAIHTRAFTDAVNCTGRNTFIDEGGRTRIVLEGTFDVDVKAVPGVPRLLAGTVKPQVEKFIVALIQPNLERVNTAVGRFLDDQVRA